MLNFPKIFLLRFLEVRYTNHFFTYIADRESTGFWLLVEPIFLHKEIDEYSLFLSEKLDRLTRFEVQPSHDLQYLQIYILSSEDFLAYSKNNQILYDWSAVYFFKNMPTDIQNVIQNNRVVNCDFAALSIDGSTHWMMSSSIDKFTEAIPLFAEKIQELPDWRKEIGTPFFVVNPIKQ